MIPKPDYYDHEMISYIRCLEQKKDPNDEDILSSMKLSLESTSISDDMGRSFLWLVDQFLINGGNPNSSFQEITIGENTFRYPTCFHVVYIYWKSPGTDWDPYTDKFFERMIDRMLDDRRVDLRAVFTEQYLLDCEHFFNRSSAAYPRQNEEEGYLLERMTIAHYALAMEDLEMVEKVLQRAPDLLQTACCLTKGKNLLSAEICAVASLTELVSGKVFPDCEINYCDPTDDQEREIYIKQIQDLDNDDVVGELALATIDINLTEGMLYPVTRIAKVTLLHLAARLGNEMACGYLFAKQANRIALDSDSLRPFDYFQVSISEGFVKATKTTKQLCKALEPIVQLNRPYLPPTCCVLKREGYDNVYDTRTKVSSYVYERLTRESLQRNTTRESSNFKVDRDVPPQNRAQHADYQKSGYDRGHLKPAGDAVVSEKAMEDTFLLTNISPQQPEFNRNYWKQLERYVRTLVDRYDLVEVFTGCLFLPQIYTDEKTRVSYEVIGNGNVAVPTHFFKVLYLHKRSISSTAYILPNAEISMNTPLARFETTVNEVQKLSGILFNQWSP